MKMVKRREEEDGEQWDQLQWDQAARRPSRRETNTRGDQGERRPKNEETKSLLEAP